MAEGGGGVKAGATGASIVEDEGEEAAAARAMARAHPGDPGPATEDEDVDLYDPQHPFITYSSFHGPNKSTLYACNTDGTPMYRATFRSNPPNILPHATNSSCTHRRTGSPQLPHGFTVNRGENYIHFPITNEQG